MCKFNNRLFVFSLICLLSRHGLLVLTKPVQDHHHTAKDGNLNLNELMALTALLTPQDNYDLHYDQRQKGEENYRIKLDGFVIGLPHEDNSALLLFTDDLLESLDEELLLTSAKNKQLLATLPPRQVSSNVETYQNPEDTKSETAAPLIVEIPSPQKHVESRHQVGGGVNLEEFHSRPGSRTRSYIAHLLNLLKRGRRN